MANFGWDLPPGVSESDIPGNRKDDERWERMIEDLELAVEELKSSYQSTNREIAELLETITADYIQK